MRRPLCTSVLAGLILSVASACGPTQETELRLSPGGFRKRVTSWRELRDRNVIIQRLDYSCGAAALATLMRYYFGDDITESDVLVVIVEHLSEEEMQIRQNEGLSMLDLKESAQRLGYQAAGVRLARSALPKLKGPVLVHLVKDDYRHFAILRGVVEDRVYLADPSRGNIRMSVGHFDREWDGVALVLGKPGFGLPSDHSLALKEKPPIRHELRPVRQALFRRH